MNQDSLSSHLIMLVSSTFCWINKLNYQFLYDCNKLLRLLPKYIKVYMLAALSNLCIYFFVQTYLATFRQWMLPCSKIFTGIWSFFLPAIFFQYLRQELSPVPVWLRVDWEEHRALLQWQREADLRRGPATRRWRCSHTRSSPIGWLA